MLPEIQSNQGSQERSQHAGVKSDKRSTNKYDGSQNTGDLGS